MRPGCAIFLVTAITIVGTRPASADGLDFDSVGARSIGRAGIAVVSDDGAAALWLNPGGMVRRTQRRLQLGISLHDADRNFTARDSPGSPLISDRGTLRAAPTIAIQSNFGRLVIGAAYVERGDLERVLPQPQLDQPAADVSRLFPHRYSGTGLRYQRRSVAVGAAIRVSNWLGIGAALGFSQTELRERRRIWAGFGSRDMPIGNPTRDLIMELEGRDGFSPEATIGALIAPPQVPLELAVSGAYRGAAHLTGDATLAPSTSQSFPRPLASSASANINQGATIELNAGLRYLGDRVFFEAGAQIIARIDEQADWSLEGVRVMDDTALVADLTATPSLVDRRDHARVGAALDVEIVSGFLWITGGYAFRSAASRREKSSAIHGDTATHTIAVGAEGHWNGNTLTVGYARTLASELHLGDSGTNLVNPFEAGTIVVGTGRYDQAHDAFGLTLEVAWD